MAEKFASIWKRGEAFLIDGAMLFVVIYILLWFNFFTDVLFATIYNSLLFMLPIIYFAVFEAKGQTLGKKLLKIKVTMINGEKPGIWRAFLRTIFRLIDALPFFYILGVILILKTKNRQRLGDLIAKTVVVEAQ